MKKLLPYITLVMCSFILIQLLTQKRIETIVDFEENGKIREKRKNQEREECEGYKKNVIFVKTHKTASSSVQNILLR